MATKANLDLDLLRTFVAVAETGGFTRAAGRLGRVQSAVSMQVKRLEEVVGGRLFERSNRKVTLSEEGEVLLGYARRMLSLNQEALSDLARTSVEGKVRLGSADTAAYFLPGILARFAGAYQQVQVEIRCDRSWNVLDALDAGDLDLALVTQQGERTGGHSARREPLAWASALGHAVHEVDPLPLAVFAQGCAYRRAAMQALDAADRKWRIAYSSTSLTGVQAAAMTGFAIGVLPQTTLVTGMRALGPEAGLPPLPDYEITLHVRPGTAPGPVTRLADEIVAHLAVPAESVAPVLPMFAVPA
ncbi:MAG: LysR substrate-binding domain-containing protein [Alphaproteobacteria bacterium]